MGGMEWKATERWLVVVGGPCWTMKVRREGRRVVHFEQYRPCRRRRCRSLFGGWKSNRRSNSLVGAANQLMMLVRCCPWRTLSRLRVVRSFGIGEPGELRDPRELQFCSHRAKEPPEGGWELVYILNAVCPRPTGWIGGQHTVTVCSDWRLFVESGLQNMFLELGCVHFRRLYLIWVGCWRNISYWWLANRWNDAFADSKKKINVFTNKCVYVMYIWRYSTIFICPFLIWVWDTGFEWFFFVFIYTWSIFNVLTFAFVTACH